MSDQRVQNFLDIEQSLVQLRLVSSVRDAWEWENAPFSIHKAYQRIRGRQGTEDETTIRACQTIYQQKFPLKVKIFGWLLLRRRLLTRVFWKKMYPDASKECVLCREGKEDCKHLFFICSFAHTIWAFKGITAVEAIYKTNF